MVRGEVPLQDESLKKKKKGKTPTHYKQPECFQNNM